METVGYCEFFLWEFASNMGRNENISPLIKCHLLGVHMSGSEYSNLAHVTLYECIYIACEEIVRIIRPALIKYVYHQIHANHE